MTDIINRLRRYVGAMCISTDEEIEGANEIERLRAEVKHWRKYAGERCDDIRALTGELEALKVAITREIDHAEINRIRTEPPFGKPKGEVCVPVRSLLAALEGIARRGDVK